VIVCPNCGEENPERFRLCGFCGTALTAALPPQEVRKTVTIVFSDLQGSTSLGERLDSEALREVMSRYFDEMRAALELHGGTIEKYIGDAIMAVFGLPVVREDDALRAVRAASDMTRRLASLNEELNSVWGVTLRNRTGVNTGEVVAGDPATGQRLVTGDTVNVAARLEQAAPALEVLIGEPTYELVRDAVTVEAVEPLELKGKSAHVGAYRLLSVKDVGEAERPHRGVFVGRDVELESLKAVFRDAVAEHTPRAVTILAEAGVGKSRLMEEFGTALGGDVRVLKGRCLPYGRGITFWPLGEIVRQAASIGDDDSPDQALERLNTAIGGAGEREVVERVASAIGLLERQFPLEEVFFAVRRFFELLAQGGPVVTMWEDLHWAEATLLDLIERLATTAKAPLLLLCTGRPSFVEVWQRELSGHTIELVPLPAEAIDRFIDGLLGESGIESEVRRRIVEAAEGNPLYVEQMLSMLIDHGVLRRTPQGWVATTDFEEVPIPPTINALLTARLDRLPTEERAVVDVASVIGHEFAQDAVQELVPDTIRAETGARLAALARKQLVRRLDDRAADFPLYRFEHILIRDAAYGGILKRRRATLHEQFADWGDRINKARNRIVEYEEILGFHLEQAYRYLGELGEPDDHQRTLAARAAAKLDAAGRRAFAREDMPAAANLLRRALELREPGERARIELIPDLSEALTQIGELAWAEVFLEEAVDAAKRQGEPAIGAEARLARLLNARFAGGEEVNWCEEVLRELETAVPVFESEDDHRRLAKAYRLAMGAYGISYRFGDAAAAAERAVRHAQLAGDARGAAVAASAYAMAALYGPTPVAEAIARCEQTLAETAGNRKVQAFVRLLMAPLYAMSDDFTTARRLYGEAWSDFQEIGATLYGARTSLQSAAVEVLAGDLPAAERELRRDYETLDRMGERYLRPTVAANLALVLCLQGRVTEAEEFARIAEDVSAPDDVESQALWRSAKAMILAEVGDSAAADAAARAAVDLLKQTDALVQIADALSVHAGILGGRGNELERRAALEEAAALYARKGNVIGERSARQALATDPR
jgi:class 3 adenylate cyclase/tetratricopeptide (TPR) repeat protein